MIDGLEQFIVLDVFFLFQECVDCIVNLKSMMDCVDVVLFEKFCCVMEVYQVEMDYGCIMEVYIGIYNIDGQECDVEFLCFGCIVLIYQICDVSMQGVWNK